VSRIRRIVLHYRYADDRQWMAGVDAYGVRVEEQVPDADTGWRTTKSVDLPPEAATTLRDFLCSHLGEPGKGER
jgi:hypothetical protein